LLRPYAALLRSRVQSQTAYRRSFALDLLGAMSIVFVEFGEVYVIFVNVDALGGLDFAGVALIYAIASIAFALADLFAGHLDELPTLLRQGTLDAYLTRPLPVLAQLVTGDISMRRLGRVAMGAAILAVALPYNDIEWTPLRLAVLGGAIVSGAAIFAGLFVCAAAVQFWLIEGREFANAFTYGGNYVAEFPASIFAAPMRVFFTFVIPAAFVAYLPALVLLDQPGPPWLPQWLGYCAPLATLFIWGVALVGWRAGLRHYTGAGS
jgi:ABC-2 type transport system permease protein